MSNTKTPDGKSHKTTSLLDIDDLRKLNAYIKPDGKEESDINEEAVDEQLSETQESVDDVLSDSSDEIKEVNEPEKTIRSFKIPEGALAIRKEGEKDGEKNVGDGPMTLFLKQSIARRSDEAARKQAEKARKQAQQKENLRKLKEDK